MNIDIYKNSKIIANVKECKSASSRRDGLLKTPELHYQNHVSDGILMVIPKDRRKFKGFINSIHMIGMKYDITVLWLDENFKVVTKKYAAKGFHFYSPDQPCKYIIELHTSAFHNVEVGDKLEFLAEGGVSYSAE